MSGHSKFANIKHKKEKNDAAKGKIFTIIGREIAIAVKEGGADPANNSKLRDVIAKAKANNMPNDTIERGIKKAAGDGDSVNYVQVTYEGYGPSGTAIIVDAFAIFLGSQGWKVCTKMLAQGKQSPMMRIPLGAVYMIIPVGIILMAVFYTISAVSKFRDNTEEKEEN